MMEIYISYHSEGGWTWLSEDEFQRVAAAPGAWSCKRVWPFPAPGALEYQWLVVFGVSPEMFQDLARRATAWAVESGYLVKRGGALWLGAPALEGAA
ncbi:MAG: hypothetical protein MUF38_01555 [Anaerolineae bacterium]|jgi:hypothetical protein|nr:hypothetical protein [Anaerolineae bacterium]